MRKNGINLLVVLHNLNEETLDTIGRMIFNK
jgi:hypothetical protein